MNSESDTKRFDCAQHCLAVSSDDCYVEDGGWFGYITDILADVELLQVFLRGGYGCHFELRSRLLGIMKWKLDICILPSFCTPIRNVGRRMSSPTAPSTNIHPLLSLSSLRYSLSSLLHFSKSNWCSLGLRPDYCCHFPPGSSSPCLSHH